MRARILGPTAVVLLLVPGVAAGDTLSVGTSVLAQSDCEDNTSDVVTYALTAESSDSTPTMQLFVTTESCPTPDSGESSVALPADAIGLVGARSITSTDESGNTATLHARALAQQDCTAAVSYAWNVCLYQFWHVAASLTSTGGYTYTLSTATVSYDAQPPGAPRLTSVEPGDQHLNVGFSSPGDDDVSAYEVLLAPKNSDTDEAVAASERGDGGAYGAFDCNAGAQVTSLAPTATSGRVPDASTLTDGLTYVVQVRAVDAAGNVGACSNPLDGTPQVIEDFWRLYKDGGGTTRGGCSTADGATLLPLLALLDLARRRLRRRPPRRSRAA